MNIVLSRGDWISIIRSITRISSLHGKLVLLKRLVAVLLKEKEEKKGMEKDKHKERKRGVGEGQGSNRDVLKPQELQPRSGRLGSEEQRGWADDGWMI